MFDKVKYLYGLLGAIRKCIRLKLPVNLQPRTKIPTVLISRYVGKEAGSTRRGTDIGDFFKVPSDITLKYKGHLPLTFSMMYVSSILTY